MKRVYSFSRRQPSERYPIKHLQLFYAVAFALAPQFCLAQQLALNSPVDAIGNVTAISSTFVSIAAPVKAIKPAVRKPLVGRWLNLETLSNSERYRNAFAVGGVHVFENAQQRSLIIGKITLDAEGRYDIGFRASSGRYFNWAFSDYTGENFADRVQSPVFLPSFFTPAENLAAIQAIFADPTGLRLATQLKSNGWQFYARELYFSATPVKPMTVEFGSFGIERGLATEITTFDDDGYLSGERIRFHDSKHFFFDEVGFTSAFFGDIATPNLFDRGSSLKKFNYRQLFVKKRLNQRLGFSGEYTWQAGTQTLRQAALIEVKESRIVDSVRFESYERLNAVSFAGIAQSPLGPIAALSIPGASGFAIAARKNLGKLSGDVGYASIDKDYAVYSGYRFPTVIGFPLNGDSYGQGNRPFMHASYTIAPGVAAFGFYTHEIGPERVITLNQQGLNAGMTFDLKAMVNHEKLVF